MGAYKTAPQIQQLQSSHDKVMLTWETTPKLNSCIIPWERINGQ